MQVAPGRWCQILNALSWRSALRLLGGLYVASGVVASAQTMIAGAFDWLCNAEIRSNST